MHLKSLKLSGFKSFVDVTLVPFTAQLCGIVGPNGCGKSNIVDAIRWVIGESSAKQLRGQAMSDVIFNGSSTRKPVGKAIVELIFDNFDQKIGGEYARLGEISVRREVDREGQSHHFLNGVHCRRRDIIDIFLGTGLGPRSYAIIEQGVISQLIEAKPDEMRLHLEEVAGISKYKERRKETESRMRDTQENINRLNDLQQELAKQCRHLKKQANAAQRYQDWMQEQRMIQAQIKAWRWQQLCQERERYGANIAKYHATQEQLLWQLQLQAQQTEQVQIAQAKCNEQYQSRQKDSYQLHLEIESDAKRLVDIDQQVREWKKEQQGLERLRQELQEQLEGRRVKAEEIAIELAELTPALEQTKQVLTDAQQLLQERERTAHQGQQSWEQGQQESAHLLQQVEVAKTQWQHCQQQCLHFEKRYQQLIERQHRFNVDDLAIDIEPLLQRTQMIGEQLSVLKQALVDNQNLLTAQREKNKLIQQSHEKMLQSLQALQKKHASLDALQQSAFVNHDQEVNGWLTQQALQQQPRLAQQLQVQPGWELAVETVLSEYFDAVCVERLEDWVDSLTTIPHGVLTLLSVQSQNEATPIVQECSLAKTTLTTLAEQIQSPWPLKSWLEGIYVAEDLTSAKEICSHLQEGESVITRDGIWLSCQWVRIAKRTDATHGILEREQELKQLQQEINLQQEAVQALQAEKQQELQRLTSLESYREEQHRHHQRLSADYTEAQAEWRAQQTRLTQVQQQRQHLAEELQECEQQLRQNQMALQERKQCYENLQQSHQKAVVDHQQLLVQRDTDRQQLLQARQHVDEQQKRVTQLSVRLTTQQNQLTLLQQSQVREERHNEQLQSQCARLQAQVVDSIKPLADIKVKHQQCLAEYSSSQEAIKQVEQQLNDHSQQLKQLTKQYQQTTESLAQLKDQLQKCQLEQHAVMVRQSTVQEQLQEEGLILEALVAALPADMDIAEWERNLEQVTQRIASLSPINLAAIEEYQMVSERKNYLDHQQTDLSEALNLLTEAMRKIDRETRAKFRETYDQVNKNFQTLFPKIFSGGKASLELVDDNLSAGITAGVMVKAQPPGKHNSTIHLLSGGEKALTALALVLALFQLNPAPFCILDEVDAPLDDTNVDRFCQLIKEMSQHIQFIVISHNKLTISAASQLMGITMQEAGVSRLVSVNVEEAVMMATE